MTFWDIAVMILVGLLAFLLGRVTKSTNSTQQVLQLQAELDAARTRLAEQEDLKQTLMDRLPAVAAQTVTDSNSLFMETAASRITPLVDEAKRDFTDRKEAIHRMVKPLSDELQRFQTTYAESQGSLKRQLEDLAGQTRTITQETRHLTDALKRPEGRGAWGEMQLRRVVELAGMSQHCDFAEQVSVELADGQRDRPDMVVYLPNNRLIVVDAKAPLQAYLDAVEAPSIPERDEALTRVAQQVGSRARELAQKAYWNSFRKTYRKTPDFVVMFLPGEFLLPVALDHDPALMDRIMEQNVVLATPNTLMALLKTVALGWQEVTLAQEAAEIGQLGKDMYDKLVTFANHMDKTGKALQTTMKHFNNGIGTLDGGHKSVLGYARQFKEHGTPTSKEIPAVKGVNPTEVREIGNRH